MKLTKYQRAIIIAHINKAGYSIAGFCRAHGIDISRFSNWLNGDPLYVDQAGLHFAGIVKSELGIHLAGGKE